MRQQIESWRGAGVRAIGYLVIFIFKVIVKECKWILLDVEFKLKTWLTHLFSSVLFCLQFWLGACCLFEYLIFRFTVANQFQNRCTITVNSVLLSSFFSVNNVKTIKLEIWFYQVVDFFLFNRLLFKHDHARFKCNGHLVSYIVAQPSQTSGSFPWGEGKRCFFCFACHVDFSSLWEGGGGKGGRRFCFACPEGFSSFCDFLF